VPVIDASVYVALINRDEQYHEQSWAWFEQVIAAGSAMAAPTILVAEVAAALARGAGDLALARRVVQQLIGSQVVDLVSVTQVLAERAAEIAAERGIRGCDAVYVAVAAQLGDHLVTLDREQLERVAPLVTVQAPG
jgi:predicted nucleic acid-binding protein